MYQNHWKSLFDLLFACFFIIVLSPILSVVYIVLLLLTKDNPIYKQDRVGLHGDIFKIYKFRTFPRNTPILVGEERIKIRNKVSPFARFLRNTSIDELPQLFNVVKGDMSLIGPRPLVPTEHRVTEQRLKLGALNVKPGITGLAQVNGRKKLNDTEKVKFDVLYSQKVSPIQDLNILLKTLPIIVERDGIKKYFRKEY